MSFLDEIKTRNISLKPVQTRITRPDGKVYLETFGKCTEAGDNSNNEEFYVIDSKPDSDLHQVIPRFFIGSQDAASNFKGLQEHEISHILNVGGATVANLPHIIYKYMPILDTPEFNIKDHFDDAILFVRKGLQSGSVLVHCNAGISRSSTVIVAYLMKEERRSLDSALQLVKKARCIAKPNPGFMKQLRSYEKELFG